MFKMSETFLYAGQIIFAVFLIILILLQQKASGLSSAFGGESTFLSFRSRRGVEKLIFVLTIVLASLFLLVSFLIVARYG